ncbi:hypothetical protein [Lentilactobacillus hilgardii]|uniref:Uncharacterized protein n=1 Tax=Lentilactobacillus hilgardii TaxID=1588 RepID=A0A6P1E7Z9_LENHI|nr:hypothetical protein [Lentilactobacillus hilgardii]EEI71784.1 hypothetical protein HMPREF0496_0974 [Lentilactobacillus hilgardii ATCC 27305]MCT3393093.1 hypothetical protein [Lentilactobacillus hilgardii]QHB51361.1 hypothetical protein GQR93_03585 [Lentilactobacillus hilgardii]RRG10337.1 MAG: hypothetical protein DUD35_07995 [Lactobacillus sp.]
MKKLGIQVLLGCASLSLLWSINFNHPVQAQARVVPANMRGVWYSYEGHGKYFKIKLTEQFLYSKDYFDNHYDYTHFKVEVSNYVHGTWVAINPVHKMAGPIAFYKYSPISIKGRWHKSLQFREGSIYYRLFKTPIRHSFNKTVPIWY